MVRLGMRQTVIKIVNQMFDLLTNKTGREIMAKLSDVLAALDEQKSYIVSIDAAVELLHDQIKSLSATVQEYTDNGITSAAADALIAKIAELKAAADKIVSDDEPVV